MTHILQRMSVLNMALASLMMVAHIMIMFGICEDTFLNFLEKPVGFERGKRAEADLRARHA